MNTLNPFVIDHKIFALYVKYVTKIIDTDMDTDKYGYRSRYQWVSARKT